MISKWIRQLELVCLSGFHYFLVFKAVVFIGLSPATGPMVLLYARSQPRSNITESLASIKCPALATAP